MKLAIYGAGGLGREVLLLAQQIEKQAHRWDGLIFIDDISPNRDVKGIPVVSFDQVLTQPIEVVIAVGEPSLRAQLADKIASHHLALATLIHPDVTVSECTRVGPGCVLAKGVYLSCDVTLGSNVYMQPNSSVGHDAHVGSHVVISTFVTTGGNVVIKDRVFIGMSAVLQQKITVEADAIIGMGAVVFNDIREEGIALGNPARVMRNNDEKRVFKSL
ncbi:NeuD/PglB/VioB family sugar acetyltransferase [Pantoea allii]|uniref:NeuD/PglB/VioB family sugar acetyltransferase n=1 Tax=Pantoea allii TaxID=574096 RepID=UPI001F4F10BA|nr:NeuD/PglB/VioB family sugar acetyltransferase [Pantoea allii]